MPVKTAKPLTTGEAAKWCGVNFQTVIRWIAAGVFIATGLVTMLGAPALPF